MHKVLYLFLALVFIVPVTSCKSNKFSSKKRDKNTRKRYKHTKDCGCHSYFYNPDAGQQTIG